ncbi:MAG: SRPBCC family protein [Bacteroidota bacterium]
MKTKHLFSMAILFLSFSWNVKAQTTEPNITYVKTVNLSADQVWEQLRIMDNIDVLSSAVVKVDWTGNHGVGGSRVCTAADGQGYFKESIVAFSDTERSYQYAVVEGVPAANMVNTFKVVDLGYQKSMVIWNSSFEFVENPKMTKEQFLGFLNFSIDEMVNNTILLAKKS